MDARRIPYDSEFDLVGAFDVIEHIDEDEQVLAQAHRALKPGGGLLLTVPQHRFLWSASDDYAYHKRRYSRGELLAKLRHAGFTVKCCTSFVTLLLPALMVSRLRNRSSQDFDPEAEFRLSPMLNRVLAAVMSAERTLIRSGVRLAAGGSLLVAAART
jgi:SAM-dependent methyltransferase